MAKILYVDDDTSYLKLVKMFLEHEGFNVITENCSMNTLDILSEHNDFELVILDVMMPDKDGHHLCREIKREFNIPILMLTALGNAQSEAFGIDNGADDYIAKPFTHEIFAARVKALLRRNRNNISKAVLDEGIELDEVSRKITIGEASAFVTVKEERLLKYLIMNKGVVLPREKILNHVWGWDYYGDPRTLDTHIKALRSKLGNKGKNIVTIRGTGYSYRSTKE